MHLVVKRERYAVMLGALLSAAVLAACGSAPAPVPAPSSGDVPSSAPPSSGDVPSSEAAPSSGDVPSSAPPSPLKTPDPNAPLLTWAPPQLVDPQTIELPTGQTTTDLDPARDYIIKFPTSGKEDTFIKGGHNIVMIGGHISSGGSQPPWNSPEHRGIYVADATGTVHIEGILIDNAAIGEADGIDIAAPLATVQIQNVRIVGLTGSETTTHADVIQPWGGVKELRIDRLTGSTDYQGLHIQPDLAVNGTEIVKNANVYSGRDDVGNWLVWLTKGSDTCETAANVQLSEVYVTPRPGRDLGNSVWPPDQFDVVDVSGATQQCLSTLSPDKTQMSFPSLPAVSGVVKKGPPPGGDFVPDGVAGTDYVSPGYIDR
jgi:hypothetical protein